MKLGICAQALYDRSLSDAARTVAALGAHTLELPVDGRSPWVDLDAALATGGADLLADVHAAGITLSALSNHQEGQLLLGPHGVDTDPMYPGPPGASAADKAAFATRRLRDTATLAERMGVDVVIAFTGCEDYARWFPWPLEDGWERMGPPARAALLPLLDHFAACGVRFAVECHPRQLAYNLETALWLVDLVDGHPALGFNLDPANLLLAGMDPVVFVAELGERIVHVHAKDGQRVPHHVRRSGLLAHGAWERPDRGFRFRVPGWGELDWRLLITELQLAGYAGVLSIEHEDATMSRDEGLAQAVAHLAPLVLTEPGGARWW